MTLEAAPHHAQFRKVRLAVISRALAVEQLPPTTQAQKARLFRRASSSKVSFVQKLNFAPN